jgi:hypothetical protein
MKKILLTLLILIVLVIGYLFFAFVLNPKSPKAQVTYNFEELNLSVNYSRPYKRDRLLFGASGENPLLPYGQYWRLGANAPTVFKTNQDIKFAGHNLKSGLYSLYAVPYEDHWQIILNSLINSSGYEQPDASFDVLSTPIQLSKLTKDVEQLTISFNPNDNITQMRIEWGNKLIIVPIENQ